MLDWMMIKLIIQPIVENAIEHGIDQKRDGRGLIRISAERDGSSIVFKVEDNGPGMEQAVINEILTKQSRGYGLYNVNERLRIQYGHGYGVSISSGWGEGTTVYVTIPGQSEDTLSIAKNLDQQ